MWLQYPSRAFVFSETLEGAKEKVAAAFRFLERLRDSGKMPK
jgi:hypothetical protein